MWLRTFILAGTRREADHLNRLAQEQRRQRGELGWRAVRVRDTRFRTKDRVMLTKNNRALGVRNGDLGVIEKIEFPKFNHFTTVTVRLDARQTEVNFSIRLGRRRIPLSIRPGFKLPFHRRVTFRLRDYDHIALGYAATTHKAQGATFDRTFVLAGGWMQDRELTYVQMSRHRQQCHIFAAEAKAGEDLSELTRAAERSRAQRLAHEHEQVLDQRDSQRVFELAR